MKLRLALIAVVLLFRGVVPGQEALPYLDKDDIWLLVMNLPEVLEVEARKGCPEIEFIPLSSDRMWAMVRNQCPQRLPASGTIGLYTVDLRDGRIWFDADETKVYDSERLQRLRRVLLSRQQLRARLTSKK